MGTLIRNGVKIGGTTVYVDDTLSVSSTNAIQNNTITTKINQIAPLSLEYDDTATYNVNDYCVNNNILYRCTTAITTAESFNPAHWTATNITADLITLMNNKVTVDANGDMYVGDTLVMKNLTQAEYDLLNPPISTVIYNVKES